jgi:3-hydroxyisobutyrate dehydrogenase-like beta-hydroxyacid dehydrogenase
MLAYLHQRLFNTEYPSKDRCQLSHHKEEHAAPFSPTAGCNNREYVMTIGLVGLGRMGSAIAQRLRECGSDVLGWDKNASTNNALASNGLRIGATPRDVAAQCDVVLSIITEDNGVRSIFSGPDGFLSGDVNGKLFVEMSTLQPMTGRELAPLVEAKGARLIESPVLGTIPQVREGKLFALVGGRAEDLERARPVLEKLTRRINHMGPNGSGYAMKLAVNLGLGAYIQALSESLALGAGQGLTLEQMLDVLQEAPYASNWLKSKVGVLKGEKPEMTLDIRTLRKDVMSAVATGALTGVPMPLSAGTLASLSAAVADGYGAGDLAELAKFVREAMVQNYG